jgi:hypothetical protein
MPAEALRDLLHEAGADGQHRECHEATGELQWVTEAHGGYVVRLCAVCNEPTILARDSDARTCGYVDCMEAAGELLR